VQGIAKKRDVVITATVVPIIMGGSKAHIRELFTILLDNAIKYSSRNSEVSLSGRIVGNYAVIDVTDQGIGIDKEDLPRIFDRFYRADPSRSKVTDGLGLGLSIAKKIVDMHKGTISVKSKPNTGTTFTVHLPLNKSVVLRA
jgi:signal transduction histidine kinase